MKVIVPPIKSQGIKTKLVPWIKSIIPADFEGVWIEPFTGTGVVAFNLAPQNALLCDTNPHLIRFYVSLANGSITPEGVRAYLNKEGALLLEKGEAHYYEIRERFNTYHAPLDFLFLNRAGFNGMIRFNRKGGFNIPFCRKPQRFAQAYVTKIVNQVDTVAKILRTKQFVFKCQDFTKTLQEASATDIVYADPPYIDRHVDYYNSWDDLQEHRLHAALAALEGKFILSTWHNNDFRENNYIKSLWGKFNVLTREHFYHVGASEDNRNPMIEALVANYKPAVEGVKEEIPQQLVLMEPYVGYQAK